MIRKRKVIPTKQKKKLDEVNVNLEADLGVEYISATLSGYANALRALPKSFDKLTREFGIDIYENMQADDEVAANIEFLVAACTAQDANVIPGVDQDHEEYDKALEISQFIGRCLDNMKTPLVTVNEFLLEALVFGSSVGEIIFKIEEFGQDKGKVVIDDIKHKNIRNYAAVVDTKNNVVGYLDMTKYRSGNSPPISSCSDCQEARFVNFTSGTGGLLENVIPEYKFIRFTYRPSNNDPKGRSILSAAYAPWWLKQQALKLWIEWAGKYAHPSYWATPPENAREICDIDGNPIEPTVALLNEGLKFQNSTFAVFPPGTKVNSLEVSAKGEAFDLLIESCNRAIRRAILNQSLATGESSHNSRSAAGVHQDALGIKIIKIKNLLGETWKRNLFKFLTIANFGADSLHLVPKMDLGEGTGFPPTLSEIAQIMGTGRWELTDEQWPRFEKKYNLIVRKKGDKVNDESSNVLSTNGDNSRSGGNANNSRNVSNNNNNNSGRTKDNKNGGNRLADNKNRIQEGRSSRPK